MGAGGELAPSGVASIDIKMKEMEQPELIAVASQEKKRRRWRIFLLVTAQIVVIALGVLIGALIFGRGNGDGSGSLSTESSSSSLHFVAIGDWGVKQLGALESRNKTMTAGTLSRFLSEARMVEPTNEQYFDPQFVIGTGDNFYPDGLEPGDDMLFHKAFMEPYESIQMPWYNVLGNHDYHSIAVAEEWSERLRSVDSRWICHRDYSVVKTVPGPPGEEPFTVQFFFIDTNPFVTHYQESINECLDTTLPAEEDTDCDGHYNGMKVIEPAMAIKLRSAVTGVTTAEEKQEIWDAYTRQQALKLSESLRHSDARWKIVVGHHPFYSQAKHGDTDELKSALLETFRENGVRLYLNGHDHTLQHIKFDEHPTHFITTGSGAKTGFEDFKNGFADRESGDCAASGFLEHCGAAPTTQFFTGANGFTTLRVYRDEIRLAHIDGGNGDVLHEYTISN